MFLFKACPKCGGDLYTENDWVGEFVKCLQCGYTREEPSPKDLTVEQPSTTLVFEQAAQF